MHAGRYHWEHFDHQADIGLRGFGRSKAEAFEACALAMTAVMIEPEGVAPQTCVEVQCSAPDDELLLVDWLNALIYEMATRRMVFIEFTVQVGDNHLTGRACGEPVDQARHQPAVEIKGATYTALAVERDQDGNWLAQCVVDV
jgi:tRNA nucleotidyltransferase (CCA-adding enzyme)